MAERDRRSLPFLTPCSPKEPKLPGLPKNDVASPGLTLYICQLAGDKLQCCGVVPAFLVCPLPPPHSHPEATSASAPGELPGGGAPAPEGSTHPAPLTSGERWGNQSDQKLPSAPCSSKALEKHKGFFLLKEASVFICWSF